MKLTRIMFGAALMLASSWCFAGATEDLLARSRALKTMSADFHEVITDEDGLELETYDGRIIIETAAKSFRLDTAEPEANAVVCNGKELYSYDPSVAQVTILSFDKIVQNSPFWLVIDPSPKVLEKFKITASGPDSFNIEARDTAVVYNVSFDKQGLASIGYTDKNKQTVKYTFEKRDFNYKASSRDFEFTVPEGVTVDDQR